MDGNSIFGTAATSGVFRAESRSRGGQSALHQQEIRAPIRRRGGEPDTDEPSPTNSPRADRSERPCPSRCGGTIRQSSRESLPATYFAQPNEGQREKAGHAKKKLEDFVIDGGSEPTPEG